MPQQQRTYLFVPAALALTAISGPTLVRQGTEGCDPAISLPDGFCAQVFADSLGRARHIVVAENGDVFVALRGRHGGGAVGVVALRDSDGDGTADARQQFGDVGGKIWRIVYLGAGSR